MVHMCVEGGGMRVCLCVWEGLLCVYLCERGGVCQYV